MSMMHHDPLIDQDLATLPTEVQPLVEWLAADGAGWRAALPSTATLDAAVATLALGGVEVSESGDQVAGRDAVPAGPVAGAAAVAGGRTRARRAPVRLAGLAGVAAMVAIVTLIAGVFAFQASGVHRGRTATGPKPTATSAPDTDWVDQPRLNVLTLSVKEDPVIAPSDPRVVYDVYTYYTDQVGGNEQIVLRRTDDAGATWHTLPIPFAGDKSQLPFFVSDLTFLVSPLDAHTVILQMYETRDASCPAGFLQPLDGQPTCRPQYRSTDGGATWTKLITPDYRVPRQNIVGLTNSWTGLMAGPASVLHAQGTRLYSAINCPFDACIRIVASDDDGATWRTVDDALAARQDVKIQDYAATPTGGTLFAVTSQGDWSTLAPTPLTLWRSDDAGATWHRIGQLPTPYDSGLVAVASADPAQPLLYLDAPHITGYAVNKMGERDPIRSYTADDLKVSTDGGRTWQSAPASQTPPRLRTYPGLLGTLADGSIVVGCVPDRGTDPFAHAGRDDEGYVTLYAWKLGDSSWRQLAPMLGPGLNTLVITTAGGKQTLWVTNSILAPLPLPTSVKTGPNGRIPYPPKGIFYHVLRFRLP